MPSGHVTITPEMEISRQIFDQQRLPRFGTSNPERMQLAFWEWMIRGPEESSSQANDEVGSLGLTMRDGKLKSGYGPYRARDLFGIPARDEYGPIWTFDRMGATCTPLTDGRFVYIGGEHEDYYDPDFYIYNDVIVFGPGDDVQIYGYPSEVFPPTDFHTATWVDGKIIVVGCLGYKDARRPGHTPVYELDLSDFHITELETSGPAPGWLFKHEAAVEGDGLVRIWGGKIVENSDSGQAFWSNVDDYALDIRSGVWRHLTQLNWSQFSVRPTDRRLFVLENRLAPEHLLPHSVAYTTLPCQTSNQTNFAVEGVLVSVTAEISEVRVIIEGKLPDSLLNQLIEEIRTQVESASQYRCTLEKRLERWSAH